MNDPILVINNIKKDFYEETSTVSVLKDVNLTLDANKMIVIMGASGSGKTTLMNIISGLEPPTDGEVLIDNINIIDAPDDIASKFRREKIGLVFQDFHLFSHLTVEENVEIPLIFSNHPEEERTSLVLNAIQRVGLSEKINHYPTELSGGEKQRVAIARAIVHSPSLLLVDEPTGNLDTNTGKEIITLFRDIVKQNKKRAILMTTHDPDAAKTADKILVLHQGIISEINNSKS